jgi:hypothetical protein
MIKNGPKENKPMFTYFILKTNEGGGYSVLDRSMSKDVAVGLLEVYRFKFPEQKVFLTKVVNG